MSSPFKLIAVLVAAGFCVPAAFAADAVTSASVVPAAQKTQDGAVLEGTKTLAAKGGDRLPDNVDAVTSASVVPVQYRQTDWKPSGFTDAKDKKRALFILDDPRHESVTYDLCVTAMKFFEEKGFDLIKNLRSASPRTTVGILVRDSLVMKIVKRWLENVRIDYAPIGDKKIHALALTPGVKLVTYHSAKGLEFDHVILPMVNDDLFPYTRNETDFSEEATENRMNEARMLLFVGMTRARHTLALLAQESFDVRPSRLLNELAPDAVEIVR